MDVDTFHSLTVRTEDGCLAWLGRRTHDGYAVRGATYVHRWAHEQFVGPVPEGWEVDHTCNRPWCVEPGHLEAVTKAENMRRVGERVVACRHGHPYTPDNTYLNPKTGRKSCRTCRKAQTRRFFEKNPGYRSEWSRRRKDGDPLP